MKRISDLQEGEIFWWIDPIFYRIKEGRVKEEIHDTLTRMPRVKLEDGMEMFISSSVYTSEEDAKKDLKEILEKEIKEKESQIKELKLELEIIKKVYDSYDFLS